MMCFDLIFFHLIIIFQWINCIGDQNHHIVSVSFPNNFQSLFHGGGGGGSDWDVFDQRFHGELLLDSTFIYSLSVSDVPIGNFKVAAAINQEIVSETIDLVIKNENVQVTFYFDIQSLKLTTSKEYIPLVRGDFVDGNEMNGWLQHMNYVLSDVSFVCTSCYAKIFKNIHKGVYEYRIGELGDKNTALGFRGSPFPIIVNIISETPIDLLIIYDSKRNELYDSINGLNSFGEVPIKNPLWESHEVSYQGIMQPLGKAPRELDVFFPGNYASSLSPPGYDWVPGENTHIPSVRSNDEVYVLNASSLIPGTYEFKATLGPSWTVNFGLRGEPGGPNIAFDMEKDQQELLLLFEKNHLFPSHSKATIPIIISDFMEAANYGNNWDTNNLKGWLKSFTDDHTFSTFLHVPKGIWSYRIGFFGGALEETIGMDSSPFNFPLVIDDDNGTNIVFTYNHKTLKVFDSANGFLGVANFVTWNSKDWGKFIMEPKHIVASQQTNTTINFAGSFNGWDVKNIENGRALAHLGYVFSLKLINLENGEYEFKVVENESWDVNYGENGLGGENMKFVISENEDITLLFDLDHQFVAHDKQVIPIISIEDFNVNSNNNTLYGWMKSFSQNQIYSTILELPKGNWTYFVKFYNSDEVQVGFAGSVRHAIPLVIEHENQPVVFTYDHRSKHIRDSVNGLLFSLTTTNSELSIIQENNFLGPITIRLTNFGNEEEFEMDLVGDGLVNDTYIYKVILASLPENGVLEYTILNKMFNSTLENNIALGTEITILYNSKINVSTVLVPFGDFIPIVTVYYDNTPIFQNPLSGWMATLDGNFYSTEIKLDKPGLYRYGVINFYDQPHTIGPGLPLMPTNGTLVNFYLKKESTVVFVFQRETFLVGDSVNGYEVPGCKLNCLNGGVCENEQCICKFEFAGKLCDVKTHYDMDTCSTKDDVESCECKAGYTGRKCTLIDYTKTDANGFLNGCKPGWYGEDCSFQAPISGGSSNLIDFSYVLQPWSSPREKPKAMKTFPTKLVCDLQDNKNLGWNEFWLWTRNDPIKHLRTVETWLFLPETNVPFDSDFFVDWLILDLECNFQFYIRYDGRGRLKPILLMGDQFTRVDTLFGNRCLNGPAGWYEHYLVNDWLHVALVLTYEGTTDDSIDISFFVNGELEYYTKTDLPSVSQKKKNSPGSGWCMKTQSTAIIIGGSTNVNSELEVEWSNPIIDEYRLWTTSRTREQLQQTMHRRISEEELEERNPFLTDIWGIPNLFVYLPFNIYFGKKHPWLGGIGTHWAPFTNEARIIAKSKENQLELYVNGELDGIPNLYFEPLNFQHKGFPKQRGIGQVLDRASSCPLVGWDAEMETFQNEPINFRLNGGVVEKLFNPLIDITYPKIIPIQQQQVENNSVVVFKIDEIIFNHDHTGLFETLSNKKEILAGQEIFSDEIICFTPGENEFSKLAAIGKTDFQLLETFATIKYHTIDRRFEGKEFVGIPALMNFRVFEKSRPVIGPAGKAMKCHGGDRIYVERQWATVEHIPLGENFSLEFWFLSIQHNKQLYFQNLGLGGEIFKVNKTNGLIRLVQSGGGLFLTVFESTFKIGNGLDAGQDIYKWSHFTITIQREPANHILLNVYIDGAIVLENIQIKLATKFSDWGDVDISFCAGLDGNNPSFEGYLDEIRVWKAMRTRDEINENMFQELNVTQRLNETLSGYWTFDHSSNHDQAPTHVKDSSWNDRILKIGDCLYDETNVHVQYSCAENATFLPVEKRQTLEFPPIASPVHVLREDMNLTVAYDQQNSTKVYVTGMVPSVLDCTNLVCSKDSITKFTNALRFKVARLPQKPVFLELENGTILNEENVAKHHFPAQNLIVKVSKPGNGTISGGNPFTQFTYELNDGKLISKPQVVSILLECPPGRFLDNSKKECLVCPMDQYQQNFNLKERCCDLTAEEEEGSVENNGCFFCPTFTTLPIITNERTLKCRCKTNHELLDPFRTKILAEDSNECLPEENLQQSNTVKQVSRALSILDLFLAFVFFSWTIYYRNHIVVRASQKEFLLTILFGIALSSLSIYFTTIDDSDDVDGLAYEARFAKGTQGCIVSLWLSSTGFILTFGPLFAKIWKVKKVFENKTTKRIRISNKYLFSLCIGLLVLDWSIIIFWEGSSNPIKFVRVVKTRDKFGNPTSSIGLCHSEQSNFFLMLIFGVHLVLLIYGSILCHFARNIDSAFSEAKYVSYAILSNFQLQIFSLPLMILTSNDPTSQMFLKSGVLFLNILTAQLFIFVPKMFAVGRGSIISDTHTLKSNNNSLFHRTKQKNNGAVSSMMMTEENTFSPKLLDEQDSILATTNE